VLPRALIASKWIASTKALRRAAVTALGGAVVSFGILLIVLPGPALIVIPAGLAILGLEFAWARRWQAIIRSRARKACRRVAVRPVSRRFY